MGWVIEADSYWLPQPRCFLFLFFEVYVLDFCVFWLKMDRWWMDGLRERKE